MKVQEKLLQVFVQPLPLLANSADDKLVIFFLFFPENSFDISCKLSSLETICMKYQNLFSGKNKKIFQTVVC